MTAPQVGALRCEHLTNPLGVDVAVPRLSWLVGSSRRGARQQAYRVLVAGEPALLAEGRADVWDSGRVESAECVLLPYGGPPLSSGQRVHWTVRVWDDAGEASEWAEPAWWEAGLLRPEDWTAKWIGAPNGHEPGDVDLFRSTFAVPAPVRRARAYVAALGVYELHCNGTRVGDLRLAPGWTDYPVRAHYQVYDLTELLHEGDNTVGVVLAEGWYAGWLGMLGEREHYGSVPEVRVQVVVDTADGETVVHGSDIRWKRGRGPILSSDLLRGERADRRLVDPAWCTPGAAEDGWGDAIPRAGTRGVLLASPAPPVRVTGELPAREVREPAPGTWIADLGQNLVGWARVRVRGAAGSTVRVRHAEMLDADGGLYVDNLRSAESVDEYVLRGDGEEVLEPSFTFHGFRYVEVTGCPEPPGEGAVVGVVVGSDVPETVEFACSDARVEQLHRNVQWGLRGNFVSVPTDCPQRDERLGWTGDAQVFARTSCYAVDAAGFWTKWLDDLLDGQSPAGGFPDVAPRAVDMDDGAPGWADAGTIVPWTLYEMYGDRRVLERAYPGMRRWVAYVETANPDLIWRNRRNNDFGDWLSVGADSDKEVLATAFFARSTELAARTAEVLGHTGEANELRDLHDRIVAAFRAAYVGADGRVHNGTQTVHALALRFGLVPDELRGAAAAHLAADVAARGDHLSTGFLGVAHLLPALSESGHDELALRLLLQDTFPSWLFQVACGATTMWERWDGWTPDGGFQDPMMNSFNHYAFGSVGEWLYGYLGGIRPDPAEPGFGRCLIGPRPGPGIDHVRTSYRSIRGTITCEWRSDANGLDLLVAVPVAVSATVLVPCPADAEVTEGGVPASAAPGVTPLGRRGGAAAFEVGAGRYAFRVGGD